MQIIELNEYGAAVWRHNENRAMFVLRSYRWVDLVIVLDEVEEARNVIATAPFSTFDFSFWVPVTVEEFAKVKRCFKEIYEIS